MTTLATSPFFVAATVAALSAFSRAAIAAPTFTVDDDDAAWIAGAMPGGWSPTEASHRKQWVLGTHASRRASAWIAFFFRPLLVRNTDESVYPRPFDFYSFALELVDRKPLPAMLPRTLATREVPF